VLHRETAAGRLLLGLPSGSGEGAWERVAPAQRAGDIPPVGPGVSRQAQLMK